MKIAFQNWLLGLLIMSGLFTEKVQAQNTDSLKNVAAGLELVRLKDTAVWVPAATPLRRLYFGNGLDAFIFSTSSFTNGAAATKLTTLRYSGFFHFGVNMNYDFNEFFGVYTGLGIKNIGFIEKVADSTIKRRVYTIGLPIGFKVGNVIKRNFGFFGGGVDVPFNYKEKGFVRRGDKEKFNEWFSKRNEPFMPYAFVGLSISPGITFKYQHYFSGMLNQSFAEIPAGGTVPQYPYLGKEAKLRLLSLGIDFHYRPRPVAQYVDDGP